MPTTPESLAQALRDRGVPSAMIDSVTPCVDVLTTRVDDESSIPIGASKMGGLPDVPPGFAWPEYRGRPLGFVAQIDLASVPRPAGDPLPETGVLSFWYDIAAEPWGFNPKSAGAFQVHWFQDQALERRAYPEFREGSFEDVEQDYVEAERFEAYSACSIRVEASASFDAEIDFDDDDCDEIEQALEEVLAEHLRPQGEGLHRLLGLPNTQQGDMRGECQLVSNGIYCGGEPPAELEARIEELSKDADDWRLLLQVDTDEDGPGCMWGDMGCIYFWIRKQDLEAGDFSKVWGILQCG